MATWRPVTLSRASCIIRSAIGGARSRSLRNLRKQTDESTTPAARGGAAGQWPRSMHAAAAAAAACGKETGAGAGRRAWGGRAAGWAPRLAPVTRNASARTRSRAPAGPPALRPSARAARRRAAPAWPAATPPRSRCGPAPRWAPRASCTSAAPRILGLVCSNLNAWARLELYILQFCTSWSQEQCAHHPAATPGTSQCLVQSPSLCNLGQHIGQLPHVMTHAAAGDARKRLLAAPRSCCAPAPLPLWLPPSLFHCARASPALHFEGRLRCLLRHGRQVLRGTAARAVRRAAFARLRSTLCGREAFGLGLLPPFCVFSQVLQGR
jgi:hypothetical protein